MEIARRMLYVPDIAAACSNRRPSNTAKERCSARPIFTATYAPSAVTKTGLRPYTSDRPATIEGNTPEATNYEVTVRLIRSVLSRRSLARNGMMGKKMKLLDVENQPTEAPRDTIKRFCHTA